MTTSQKFTDTDGDTLRLSLATPAEQFPNGSIIVRADEADNGESAAVRMTADHLRGMIDAVSPPIDYADGGVTAALIEAEVVSPEQARSLVQENDELRARIGRVEEARDLYRRDVMTAERREQEASDRADEADKRAATASPRPLTADDIPVREFEAMADRALARWDDAKTVWAPRDAMREAMRAALTPPPSRPEGAEEIEALIDAWKLLAVPRPTLPDYLAARLIDPTVKEQS